MASSFSPVPANLTGFPVTARTLRAAPPRASPSNLVNIMPSMPRASSKAEAAFHGILACHSVNDQQDLRGFHSVTDAPELIHQRLVDVQAAGRIEEDQIVPVLLRMGDAGPCDLHGSAWPI